MHRLPELVVLDADDTLWESALFFERAEEDFVRLLESAGIEAETVRATVHRRDLERLETTGYGARPYLDTLRLVMEELAGTPPPRLQAGFEDISSVLLGHPVILYPGTLPALEWLASEGVPAVVYTMGENGHQSGKFDRSGLAGLVRRCVVADRKSPGNLRLLLDSEGVDPQGAVCVGNSPRSDINPALAVGASAVLLSRDRLWAAEREDIADPDRVHVISCLSELPGILRRDPPRG